MFALENDQATPIKILSIGIYETGTTDTPYLRVVPIGQIYQSDYTDVSSENISILKMDSTYPALDIVNVCQLNTDVGIIPFGVPEAYLSDGSAGTPKGFNYLHTKDFQGPLWRVFFPEMEMSKQGAANEDMLGHALGFWNRDIGIRRSGLVLNQGEGLAIVASAETAVAVATSFSGWVSLSFAMQIDIEPAGTPYLNLSGLQTGSDIVILDHGTTTEYQNIDAYSGTTWAWNYDPDVVTMVDVCIYKVGFKPFTVRNLTLTSTGATIPIQQQIDLNYF